MTRPTPETDALHQKQGLTHASYREFARRLERERDEAREACDKLRDMLVRETATQKHKHERWLRLCFDMLSVYKEGQEFNITQERVECWREEWNQLTGMNAKDYLK
jgi:hypothetical protein